MLNRVTLDGFFAGPNGELDWFIRDSDMEKMAHEVMRPDTIIFGRVSYQVLESFWPQVLKDPDAPAEMRTLANELHDMTKVVFSTTLEDVTWENSKLVKGNLVEEVRKLQQGKEADTVIFGSGSIVRQLADVGLIDEYLLAVTPIVLGAGKPLFGEGKPFPLTLLEATSFPTGMVLLHYKADNGG